MNDENAQILLTEIKQIRQLLELLAEPAIAERDAKLREELHKIAGNSQLRQKAILLMNGTRTQAEIVSLISISKGNLSTLVSTLDEAGLIKDKKKYPDLSISIPSNFFEAYAKSK